MIESLQKALKVALSVTHVTQTPHGRGAPLSLPPVLHV